MNNRISSGQALRRSLDRSSSLWAVLLIMSLLRAGPATAQRDLDAYRGDNSDWWSYTGRADSEDEGAIQRRELSPANFEILGVKLNDDAFGGASKRLGNAGVVQRGDASTGRTQICYSSAGKQEKVYLIFEKGEVNDAFYLFTGGRDWEASDRCKISSLVTSELSTGSGLHLGQSGAQVRAILGKPSSVSRGKLIYSMMLQKKTSVADLEKVKKQNPELGDDELRRNYEFYTLGIYIEARFVKD